MSIEYGMITSTVAEEELDKLVLQLSEYGRDGWSVFQTIVIPDRDLPLVGRQPLKLIILMTRSTDSWPRLMQEWNAWCAEETPLAGAESFVKKFKEESTEFLEEPSLEEAVDCVVNLMFWTYATDDPRTFIQALREKLEKVKTRHYELQPDGTYHHVKES